MESPEVGDYSYMDEEKMIHTDYPAVDYELDLFEPLLSSVYSGSL